MIAAGPSGVAQGPLRPPPPALPATGPVPPPDPRRALVPSRCDGRAAAMRPGHRVDTTPSGMRALPRRGPVTSTVSP